jgi:hypothetical protein
MISTIGHNTLEEALRYRGLHWSIIPLLPRSKRAAGRWRRFCRERPRRRDLQRWFVAEDRNVAVVCGAVSDDLCVRDFDIDDAYFAWKEKYPDLADRLPTSRTARGFHVLFRTDRRDGTLPDKSVVKMPDGELRIKNCHTTLPPSVHESGRRYEWLREPHHGVPLVYSVAEAGLISPVVKTGFGGARARVLAPCHCMPLHSQKSGALSLLFGADGRLSEQAFDDLLGWTLPTGPGMREACLWRLVRHLKTLQETRRLPVDEVEPVARRWWQLALPKIRTKEWFETWAAFARAWERAVIPMTENGGRMTEILDRARRAGCPAELRDRFGGDVCGLVAAICRELAAEADGGQFFLCRDTLSRLCGISQGRASACLQALIASRVIRRVKEAERRRAAEYVYLRSV